MRDHAPSATVHVTGFPFSVLTESRTNAISSSERLLSNPTSPESSPRVYFTKGAREKRSLSGFYMRHERGQFQRSAARN